MPQWLVLSIGGHFHEPRAQRAIEIEAFNIWGPWFTKREIEACLQLYWDCQVNRNYHDFFGKWLVQPFKNINLSSLTYC